MTFAVASAPQRTTRLGLLDRFLPVWIGLAMLAGLGLGTAVPGLPDALSAVQIDGVSVPIALGLLVMMYPPLAKVRYDKFGAVAADRRLLVVSLGLNWVVGPAVMFTLAWLLLPDLPEYRTGLIIVGLARCIAMVVIWNDLACGDRNAAAFLVALNSIFQVVMFAGLGWFYLDLLPGWLGLQAGSLDVSTWQIAKSVLIFLGIPLAAGFLGRRVLERVRGRQWYERTYLPRISPWALYGLLFTIVILFSLQGSQILDHPFDVARIAVPLLLYFALMWAGAYYTSRLVGMDYPRSATVAFTAAGNNFELAIAVAIGTFGATSGQALAGVVGPLIEVPALVALVYISLMLRKRISPAHRRAQAESHTRKEIMTTNDIRETVRQRYAAAATSPTATANCCGPAGANDLDQNSVFGITLYSENDQNEALSGSLGCGVPTQVADLQEGETVLDLGSGTGGDVLLSAQRVGPSGKVYGLDMTDEMLDKARRNAQQVGVANVEFLKGYLEQIPLPDDSVDIALSNCVINLAADKQVVLRETARVIRPGGRIAFSDVIASEDMPEDVRKDMQEWTGCIAGALTRGQFEQYLADAGFVDITITPSHQVHDYAHSALIKANRPRL